MIITRGKLWYTINTNCGFINFHPHGFWADSKGVECDTRQSDNLQSAVLIAVFYNESRTIATIFMNKQLGTINNYRYFHIIQNIGSYSIIYSIKRIYD